MGAGMTLLRIDGAEDLLEALHGLFMLTRLRPFSFEVKDPCKLLKALVECRV